MAAWLHLFTKDAVRVIETMALIVVVVGTIEAFLNGPRVAFPAAAAARGLAALWTLLVAG